MCEVISSHLYFPCLQNDERKSQLLYGCSGKYDYVQAEQNSTVAKIEKWQGEEALKLESNLVENKGNSTNRGSKHRERQILEREQTLIQKRNAEKEMKLQICTKISQNGFWTLRDDAKSKLAKKSCETHRKQALKT